MALTKCPECGKKVSDAAPACPQCGYPIMSAAAAPIFVNRRYTRSSPVGFLRRVTQAIFKAVAVFLLFGLVLVIFGKLKADRHEQTLSVTQPLPQSVEPVSLPPVIAEPQIKQTATPPTPPTPPRPPMVEEKDSQPHWEQIDEWKPSQVYVHFVVKTDVSDEPGFRKIIYAYRAKLGNTYPLLLIDFFPNDVPNPRKLAEYNNAKDDDDSWDDNQIAAYTSNKDNGLDQLQIFREALKALPIEGVRATEIYSFSSDSISKRRSIVVRVGSATRSFLQIVVDYYERVYNHPDALRIYFTTSDLKWRKYPRPFSGSVPKEITMVYVRDKDKVQWVEGVKFK